MNIETKAPLKPDLFSAGNELSFSSAGTFHNIQSKQMSRDYKGANWKAESKSVDPKEMTNEQLEEILRTGSVFSKYSERASDSSFNPIASVNSPKNQGSSLEPKKAFGQMQKQLLTGSQEFTQPKFSNKLLETGLGEKFDTPDRKQEKASSRLQSSSSKAYTTAMKALQEKLKQLERENAHYKAREKLSNEEQGRMQQRTRDEIQKCLEVEKKLRLELNSVKQESSKKCEVLQKQVELLEREKERHIEQNSIEREKWRNERNEILNQLNEQKAIIENLNQSKKDREIELSEMKNQVDAIGQQFEKSKINTDLENKKLKSKNRSYKNKISSLQKQLDKKLLINKSDLDNAINELEKCKIKMKEEEQKSKEIIKSLKRTIETQKKEIEASKHRLVINKSGMGISKQAKSKAKKVPLSNTFSVQEPSVESSRKKLPIYKKKKVGTSHRQSLTSRTPKSQSRSKSREKKSREQSLFQNNQEEKIVKKERKPSVGRNDISIQAPSFVSPTEISSNSSKGPSPNLLMRPVPESLSDKIFYLERETTDLNHRYKDLLAKSQESSTPSALNDIKAELGTLSHNLEEKSERLFELKKQQQLELKSNINIF